MKRAGKRPVLALVPDQAAIDAAQAALIEAELAKPLPPVAPVAVSWAPEMLVGSEWCGNALRFATEEEAARSGAALLMRWFVPTDSRAVASLDPVNYRMGEHAQDLIPVGGAL